MIAGLEHYTEAIAALIFLIFYLGRVMYEHKNNQKDAAPAFNGACVIGALVWLISCFMALHRVTLV